MTTNTSESGLERLICTALTGHPCGRKGHPGRGRRAARASVCDRYGLALRQFARLRPRLLP